MFFTRTYRYNSSMPVEEIKQRLLGQHVKVHKLDFEIYEKEHMIKIIPHAEQEEHIKTLPITHVEFVGKGSETQVVISSKMRKIDKGGPMLLMTFCGFMLIAAILFLVLGKKDYETIYYTLFGISAAIFGLFWLRLESGYFDYVRKIRDYIKQQSVA